MHTELFFAEKVQLNIVAEHMHYDGPTKEGKEYEFLWALSSHTAIYNSHFIHISKSSLNKHYFRAAEVDNSYTKPKTVNAQYLLRENLSVVFFQWCNCVQTLQER